MVALAKPLGYAPTSLPPGYNPVVTNNTTISTTGQPVVASGMIPQTGLIGAENALLGGFTGAQQAINQGTLGASQQLGSIVNDASQVMNAPATSMTFDATPNAATINPLNQAASQFDPYVQTGQNAQKLQADLSGANGAQAQETARANFMSSPGMQYQLEQSQRAIERSAAARGGLLGGNVLQELQRNAIGLASQDYQNQFNNLSTVANAGLGAAGQVAGIRSNQASLAGGLQQAGLGAQANLESQRLGNQTSLMQQQNQLKSDARARLASLAESSGLNIASLYTGTGEQLASGRTQAGRDIAANANAAAGNISKLLSDQGVQVSDLMSRDISSITDLIYQSGMQDKIDNANLAALLANINGGQASNILQGQTSIGAANAAGTIGVNNALQSGLQNAIATGVLGGK